MSEYLAINGKEARDIIKINFSKKVDETPMLKIGNTFHRLQVAYSAQITAFPNEVEVPDIDYIDLLETPEVANGEFNEHFKKIEDLSEYRTKLLAKLEELDSILDKAMPEVIIDEVIGGDVPPDEVRINHELPVPQLKKVGTDGMGHDRKAEVSEPARSFVKSSK